MPQRRPLVVTGLGIEGWGPFAAAATFAAIVSVLFIAWTANRWVSDEFTIGVDDIGEGVAALLAAGSCIYAAARNSGRIRVAWALFGVSALSWPGWATGLFFGLLLSAPSAIVTKAWAPILGFGAIGGMIIGVILPRVVS